MSHAPAAFTVPVALLLLLIAVLAGITAGRGWSGSLPRRGRLGIHSPATRASDEAFTMANKVAAPVVGGAALVAAVLAGIVLVLPLPWLGSVIIGVAAIAAVGVLLVAGGVLGERAARSMPVPARRPTATAACDGCACGSGGCTGLGRSAAPIGAAAISSEPGPMAGKPPRPAEIPGV